MKNRLKHWRHQFQMERREFAEYLGVNYNHYTRWETNVVQPGTKHLYDIWERIRIQFPEVNLQDLLEK